MTLFDRGGARCCWLCLKKIRKRALGRIRHVSIGSVTRLSIRSRRLVAPERTTVSGGLSRALDPVLASDGSCQAARRS